MATPIPEPRWFSLGPHAFFDLVRLARRGRSTLVRVAYVVVLFGALAVVYDDASTRWLGRKDGRLRFEQAINTNARIAERFTITVLVAQNIAVLVLMPIYCAASVFEERDKRTLPILFTTHLTAREILLGKLVSRVGHVGAVVLAGLPILAIAQLWGGIDMPMIAANFWNTGLWLVSVGTFSLMVATQSRSLVIALVKTYLVLVGASCISMCCCGFLQLPFGFFFLLQPGAGRADNYLVMWMIACFMTIIHYGLTTGFFYKAVSNLNAQRGDAPMAPEVFDIDDELVRRSRTLPEVGDDPIAWKERHLDASTWAHLMPLLMLPYLGLIVFAFVALRIQDRWGWHREQDLLETRKMVLTFLFFAAGMYILLVAIRLAGCIVRERERQTLEGLLVLPISTGEILDAKLAGIAQRYRLWLLPIGLAWLITQLFGDVNWLAGFAVLFLLAVHFYFFAMLALFLSVICRSSVAAYVSLGLILLTLLIGSVVFNEMARVGGEEFVIATNPVASWITVAQEWWFRGTDRYVVAVCLNAGAYFIAAVFLHVAKDRRFARDSQ